MKKTLLPLLLLLALGCTQPETPVDDIVSSPTHGKLSDEEIITNQSTIFDSSKVQTMTVTIDPTTWTEMQANLEVVQADATQILNYYVCDLQYGDLVWENVGIKYKGNSNVSKANSAKLNFKLDFDEFELTYPETANQRFYGFKQLNLCSNYDDESYMHEVVSSKLYKDFGIARANSSFYELYINNDASTNNIYYGLYSLVEEVDNTVVKTQFDDSNGNLYKPEGAAATFAADTYNTVEYAIKTDTDLTYTDIKQLYDTINSSVRTTDEAQWTTNLEAILNVDTFLKWLAANTTMVNYDSYGVKDRNYYLYNHNGIFEWIPTDNANALVEDSKMLDFDTLSTVTEEWPLINYILAVDSYNAKFKEYVKEFADNYFNETYLNPIYDTYSTMIKSSVVSESAGYSFTDETLFTTAVDTMKLHTSTRNSAATSYAQTN